jgi:hypothetical protein
LDRATELGLGRGSSLDLLGLVSLGHMRGLIDRTFRTYETHLAQFDIVIGEMARRLRNEERDFVVAYLPSGTTISNSSQRSSIRRSLPDHKDDILAILTEYDVQTLDLEPTLLSLENPMALYPFELPFHFTPEGYRLLADTIANELDTMGYGALPGQR